MDFGGSTRSRKRTHRKQQILEAAEEVFSSKGFYSARVEEIAHLAGVAKGTVYLYFPSKEDLFIAVLEQRVVELNALIRAELSRAGSPIGQLRALVQVHREVYRRHRAFLRVLFTEIGQLGSDLDLKTREIRRTISSSVEFILSAGISAGAFRPVDARISALGVLGTIHAVGLMWVLGELGEPDDPGPWDKVLDLLAHGLLAQA